MRYTLEEFYALKNKIERDWYQQASDSDRSYKEIERLMEIQNLLLLAILAGVKI